MYRFLVCVWWIRQAARAGRQSMQYRNESTTSPIDGISQENTRCRNPPSEQTVRHAHICRGCAFSLVRRGMMRQSSASCFSRSIIFCRQHLNHHILGRHCYKAKQNPAVRSLQKSNQFTHARLLSPPVPLRPTQIPHPWRTSFQTKERLRSCFPASKKHTRVCKGRLMVIKDRNRLFLTRRCHHPRHYWPLPPPGKKKKTKYFPNVKHQAKTRGRRKIRRQHREKIQETNRTESIDGYSTTWIHSCEICLTFGSISSKSREKKKKEPRYCEQRRKEEPTHKTKKCKNAKTNRESFQRSVKPKSIQTNPN